MAKVAEWIKRYWAVPAAIAGTLTSTVAIINSWETLGLPVFVTKEFHEERMEDARERMEDAEERLLARIEEVQNIIIQLHERRERIEELNAIIGSLEKGLLGLEPETEAWESINAQLQSAKQERDELESESIDIGG